jgi:[protein-PII] uridylyltransferase
VVADAPIVTVVAGDRPGLLSTVTGVLALRGLDVRSADIAGEDGFAVEVFVVEPARGRWPDWELVSDELEAALRGNLPLEQLLADQARVYAGGRRPTAPAPPITTVTVDNSASASSTVVELHAADAVGLLHRVTTSLFEQNLDVTAARVSTTGHEVVDAFYVRDKATGGKVMDVHRIDQLERAVRDATRDATEMAGPTGKSGGDEKTSSP